MRTRYSMFTLDDGGIIDDLMVTNAGDHLFMVVNAGGKAEDIAHMRARIGGRVKITPLEDRALLALQGPQAAAVLSRLAPEAGRMKFMNFAMLPIDGIACFVTRSGYTGEDGYEISVPADKAERFVRKLLEQPEVKPAGLGARDSLRLEAGLCLYGHDIDRTTTPAEADLGWTDLEAAPRGGRVPRRQAHPRRAGQRPEAPARRHSSRRPRAGARAHEDHGRAGPRDRRDHQRRLRTHRRRPGGDGLCRARVCCAGHRGAARRARRAAAGEDRGDAGRAASVLQGMKRTGDIMAELKFTKEHEWIRVEGDIGTVGISDYAQTQLGDVVYVEVPAVGKKLAKGGEAAVVELVKAASEIYAPVSGEVTAGNDKLSAEPALVNSSPLGDGWFFKMKIANKKELAELMDEAAYKKFVDGAG